MNKYFPIIAAIGAVLLLIGAIVQITRLPWAPYIYIIGAVLFATIQIIDRYNGQNIAIQRLKNIQIIGDILLVVTGIIMLLRPYNEWIVCLTIAAFLELYTAFRIPQEEEKEKKRP
ncbi:MAG TPA: hypothetical protein H9818_01965 [Candidatus Phocaeicola gallistercoris]|jgi:uncharacterized membrane protein|nr:hypothetical protein [Candidatus Phocaeicola gallistercoris]